MRKSITRTPQSEEDAYETYRYIALDSVDAAEAYFDALFDTFDKLLENPIYSNPLRDKKSPSRLTELHIGRFPNRVTCSPTSGTPETPGPGPGAKSSTPPSFRRRPESSY